MHIRREFGASPSHPEIVLFSAQAACRVDSRPGTTGAPHARCLAHPSATSWAEFAVRTAFCPSSR